MAAPANVTIAANTAVNPGSVTNVAFFANGVSVGSDPTAPFSITANSLGAGDYILTAVATAAGVSATSAPVNITVVAPVAVTVTPPSVTSGQFQFSYSADPGLRYIVESSSDLINWTPRTTNVAAGNPVPFSDSFVPAGSRYYRVGRLPNP